uniref:DNA-(apurinic or apyrimidinic site) lyase n=1 Tax=Lingulaulax polyedra TaxID=160621 RepID=A0A516AG73_LINPO|nr:N-glycosylase/DNA lyase [Lingulodinium polyedra]
MSACWTSSGSGGLVTHALIVHWFGLPQRPMPFHSAVLCVARAPGPRPWRAAPRGGLAACGAAAALLAKRRGHRAQRCAVSRAALGQASLEVARSGLVDLGLPPKELRASSVLPAGQAFQWFPVGFPGGGGEATKDGGIGRDGGWVGALGRHVLYIEQTPETTLAACLNSDDRAWEPELREYLNANVSVAGLYRDWAAADPRIAAIAAALPGIRVLRQDPVECLFSFICSSNNNIKRIQLMLSRLRRSFGDHLGVFHLPSTAVAAIPALQALRAEAMEVPDVPTPELTPVHFFAFPSSERLAAVEEEQLRGLGFGFRAKWVAGAAAALHERGGRRWLLSLRGRPYAEVRAALMELPGVGPKVADCVALYCLEQPDCVPVDVHVWRVACRDYDEDGEFQAATLTPKLSRRVSSRFQTLFGSHAGWAQCLIFAAELPMLRDSLQRAAA